MVNLVNLYLLGKNKLQCLFWNVLLFNKNAKEKLDQIDLRILKLLYHTKNGILSNFDLHSLPSKLDIIWVIGVVNLRICILQLPWETVQIREFATAVTQNISNLDGRPWIYYNLKFLGMPFSVILEFDDPQINLMELF